MRDRPDLTARLPASLRAIGCQVRVIYRKGGMPMIGPKKWNLPEKPAHYMMVDATGKTVLSDRLLKNLLSDATDMGGAP
jgi:hypothetical protein